MTLPPVRRIFRLAFCVVVVCLFYDLVRFIEKSQDFFSRNQIQLGLIYILFFLTAF